jgi:endonuclease/exonuclease/phosphatase (EEP) superfamily protein YafD
MNEPLLRPAVEQSPGDPAAAPRGRLGRRLLMVAVLAYGLAIVGLTLWMRWQGDRNWLATLFLFGPRWICILPLPVLALWAALQDRRQLGSLAAILVLIVGPLMGFQASLSLGGSRADLRVMTCNVDQRAVRIAALALLIDDLEPDVVALQEVRAGIVFQWPPGWYVLEHDEFILASRYPIAERGRISRPGRPGETAALHFVVQLPDREVNLFNLHLESPRPGFEAVLNARTGVDRTQVPRLQAVLKMRSDESEQTSRWVAETEGPKLVVGDFNMPPDSTLFRRDWSNYQNAFSVAGWGFGFTKISEKRGWSYGARIDHVLYSPAWRCTRVFVAPEVGSDHLPLVADIAFE